MFGWPRCPKRPRATRRTGSRRSDVKTRYGVSPWIHQFPGSRVPDFPRFRGERTTEVAIVGGGLTGCAVAYACAVAGLKAVVIERDRIGRGSGGRGPGLLLPEPGPAFRDVVAMHGLRVARRLFESWRRGALDAAALLRREAIRCDLQPVDVVTLAARDDEKPLRREADARRDAGFDARLLTPKQLVPVARTDAAAAMRQSDAFVLDPYRACNGLARASVKRRVPIFERTAATKVRVGRHDVEIATEGGVLRAQTVVVTTGSATPEFKPLRRHFKPRNAYNVLTEAVPAAVRRQLFVPKVALADRDDPAHRVRWTADSRLVVTGADQDEVPARTRDAVLVQRTGQLMYELLTRYPAISGLRPEYGWDVPYGETADGIGYYGPHRNYPRHLFALGGRRDSATGSFLAARILLRALRGEPEKGDDVFAFTR
jgi:glycine/D-amino acid oxidase-like deaminating enzyme